MAAAWRAAPAGMAVFIPWDTKQFCWPRLPKTGFKMPQAALLPSSLAASTQAYGTHSPPDRHLSPQTPPLRQQLAGAWTNTCTEGHCQASWWNHPGSPSSSQAPTFAVLNTTALCHLVILGKKNCSRWYQPHKFGRANFASGSVSSPSFVPCWYLRGLVSAGMERSCLPWLSTERKDHSLLFSGSMAVRAVSRLPTRTRYNPIGSSISNF